MGGWDCETWKKSDKIYYALSTDICNDSINNIWHISHILLPFPLKACKCMITHQSTKNPKLIILGGLNENNEKTNLFLQYKICDIIGNDKYSRFILDLKKVCKNKTTFLLLFCFAFLLWFCFCFCFVCVCVCVCVRAQFSVLVYLSTNFKCVCNWHISHTNLKYVCKKKTQ